MSAVQCEELVWSRFLPWRTTLAVVLVVPCAPEPVFGVEVPGSKIHQRREKELTKQSSADRSVCPLNDAQHLPTVPSPEILNWLPWPPSHAAVPVREVIADESGVWYLIRCPADRVKYRCCPEHR